MKKKTLLIALSVSILMNLLAIKENDLLITEIMYNPPEEGVDSLEFIRLTNVSDKHINLEGYYLSGVDYTVDSAFVLAPFEDFVLCKNKRALESILSIEAHSWKSGSLSNTGEVIKVYSSDSMLIDSVHYKKTGDWPKEAAGEGYSIYYCPSYSSSNDEAKNWFLGFNTYAITDSQSLTVAMQNDCIQQLVNVMVPTTDELDVIQYPEYLEVKKKGVFQVFLYDLQGRLVYYSQATDVKLIDKYEIDEKYLILKLQSNDEVHSQKVVF